jgi:Signal transduction histidine kinase
LPNKERYDFKASALYHNLGISYFHIEQYAEAEKYLFRSLELQERDKDTVRMVSSYMDIANLYYAQYKDNEAIPYFEKAYQLSKKTKDFELKQNSALNMAVMEENRKQFSRSLEYRKEYESWRDSLNNQNKIWALAELEKEYAVTEKEKEIKVLRTENKLKIAERNALLLSSVFLMVLFGAGTYFFRQKIKSNRIILSQKKDLDQLNLTKDKLFSIVSHDLRSSVNALKTSNKQLFEQLEAKSWAQLDKLLQSNSSITNSIYNLLDNLLNWSMLQTKQLYFNIEAIHLPSVVQQVAYNYKPLMAYKNIAFEYAIPKGMYVQADLDSVKIILRNLLDNAIKFSKEKGIIKVYCETGVADSCHLVVEDLGVGMPEETREELLRESILLNKKKGQNEIVGTGLGLQLCKEMVKKNNGLLLIESQENIGTKIIIQLPKTAK